MEQGEGGSMCMDAKGYRLKDDAGSQMARED